VKKTFGVVSRALLIGVTAALIGAPVALAAEPGPGSPTSKQCQAATADQVLGFQKRATRIEDAAKASLKAATDAKTKKDAEAAKSAAEQVKADNKAFNADIQKFLDGDKWTDDDRICAGQQMTRGEEAAKVADQAIKVAQDKIDEKPSAKADIVVAPDSVARGDVIGVAVFCPKGKIGEFSSDAIEFVPESRYEDGNVVGIGGFIKKDAAPGKHSVTSSCGDEKLTASFTVTAAPPVEAKKPTPADARRKVVIKPKGKIETGGGATAVVTV
jgi:hypothetical protein